MTTIITHKTLHQPVATKNPKEEDPFGLASKIPHKHTQNFTMEFTSLSSSIPNGYYENHEKC
jgi:hypothetical protein